MKITRIVLDVMSPAQQSIVELVDGLNEISGISKVDITLLELEKNVEEIKVTLDGEDLNYEEIRSNLNHFGAVIRNVDSIISASEAITDQDNDKLTASILVLATHIGSKNSVIGQIFDEFDGALEHIRLKKVE